MTEKEEEKFQKDLSSILDYFKILEELDTKNIQPTFHPTENFLAEKGNVFRKDEEKLEPEELAKKLVEAVPEKSNGFVKVKAIFE